MSGNEPSKLPLDSWHRERGARMVEFAGYEMPIQYEGIIAEHNWTREHAGLFDVSHMGQLSFAGDRVAEALEGLLPGDFKNLKPGKSRYSVLLNDSGGIKDDLIVTNADQHFIAVVNGATKQADYKHFFRKLPSNVGVTMHQDQALLALQGPDAEAVMVECLGIKGAPDMGFMTAGLADWRGNWLWISRSGYTGEDGFEISVHVDKVKELAARLVSDKRVKPVGLGARDSLRLEAGLPLYGHDLDEETTPVMADLGFAISKRRREEGRFPGDERILGELKDGSIVKRVGFTLDGRQPVREGAKLLDGEGNVVGKITSGGFSPSLERPIAMGYLATHLSDEGTVVKAEQRGKLFDVTVAAMPFVPHRYKRQQGKK
ncbi:glycine cleavage system aminomethyltransferase GcvT [Sphingomicrobium sediminis]|uniref:aminomethyltransferase n=1 Tax=Sphingomicrobium sediminis TaxID=2950949 RepID=A0A9X2J2K0_9SPHN|nr:glycine cleavage system aminomethyltransferase GcvT [Sphingomicrobium sediminis]MCM8557110.1 glycine cleavage system aminomethyltransferase GcvT [Sphingomicrobium sediminis]